MKKPAIILLGALLLLGAILRVYRFGYGLPGFYVPDAQVVSESMDLGNALLERDLSFFREPHKYPLFLPDLILLAHGLFFLGFDSVREFTKYIALHQEVSFLIARFIAVAAGVLIILLSFLTARLLGRRNNFSRPQLAGLFAAFLTATSLLLTQFSRQERPHIVAGFWLLATYFFYLRFGEKDSWPRLMLLVLAAGFAAGTLQNGLLAVFFPILAAIDYWRKRHGRKKIVIGAALLAALLFLFYPALFFGRAFDLTLSGGGHQIASFHGRGFARIIYNLAVYDPVILLSAVLGIFLRQGRGLLAGFMALYFFVFGLHDMSPARFAIPLVIFGAVLGGLGAACLLERKKRAAVAAALALLVFPAVQAGRLTYLLSRPDTRDIFSVWVLQNVRRSDGLLINNSILALPPARAAIKLEQELGAVPDRRELLLLSLSDQEYPKDAQNYLRAWKFEIGDYEKFLKESRVKYVAVSSENGFISSIDGLARYAQSNLKLAASIPGHSAFPADFQNPLREIWRIKNLGPEIRIYEVLP